MRFRFLLTALGFSACIANSWADTTHKGVALSFPVITKDPQYVHAYQLTGWYQPKKWHWQHVRVYLTASVGHWWVINTNQNHSLNIYSFSPVLRYFFFKQKHFSPFVNLGIGVSYLSRTRIETRNLGMHLAFQDQLGVGVSFGKKRQASIIFSGLHYSNGSLCSMNAGITIPVMATIEYGF